MRTARHAQPSASRDRSDSARRGIPHGSGDGSDDAPRATCDTTCPDRGSVTAETAVVLPVLLVVLALLVWALACVAAQLGCVDAARSAARLAARGEPPAVVVAAAREVGPAGATVTSTRSGQTVRVLVQARVRPFGGAVRMPSVTVSASAAALLEESLGSGGRP